MHVRMHVMYICEYMPCTYVTRSGKTSLITTITDIIFLPVGKSCTHALPRNTKYVLDHRWPGLLLWIAFYRCYETMRVHFMTLEGINRTARVQNCSQL